jgi:hypothetical protein
MISLNPVVALQLESVATLCPNPSVLGIGRFDHGWNSEKPEFAQIVQSGREHAVIFEVGSWFGKSALRMAELCPNAVIVAIDTWLGGTDHMPFRLPRQMGFPDLYRQFLMNVASSPHADRIFPLVQTSRNAARLLRSFPAHPTLVYIDASHESPDVYDDAMDYYALLGSGGTIFGDDYDAFPAVASDVNRFCGYVCQEPTISNGFWSVKKP